MEITSERIDDIPVIVEWLKQMDLAKCIDQKLRKPHGNHKGMSYGQLSVLLLTYIITQSDHRLSAVEPWVEAHRKILELSTGWSIGEKDASDDRLARVVEELGKQSEARQEIEVKLGRHLIRAYKLPTEVARADTSSFSVNHQQGESPEESLLRHGFKTDRPSAEKMLLAFCNLTLYFLPNSTIFITPLSELQKQILSLMKMPEALYQVDSLGSST